MRKILEECPTCNNALHVTRLNCTVCETQIEGRYTPCRFCRLSPEDLQFMELFVQKRGNIKEMERDLAVSYWAIRGRLNEVIEKMGFAAEDGQDGTSDQRRRAILDQLDRGEISASEAADLLAVLDQSPKRPTPKE